MCWILQPTMFLLGWARVLLGPTLVFGFLQAEQRHREEVRTTSAWTWGSIITLDQTYLCEFFFFIMFAETPECPETHKHSICHSRWCIQGPPWLPTHRNIRCQVDRDPPPSDRGRGAAGLLNGVFIHPPVGRSQPGWAEEAEDGWREGQGREGRGGRRRRSTRN